MRILFDSKVLYYKDPFGTLLPGENCTLRIRIPISVASKGAECLICDERGTPVQSVPMTLQETLDPYQVFSGNFHLEQPGLYFYYFLIHTPTHSFRLFKYGNDTNMEEGGLWQVSCIPADFTTPQWAKGAVIYQVFPDRFHKSGDCDLTGKLEPYTVHENWDEEVSWQPTPEGIVLNNDFYGGNFRGITEKLPYIASLGTNILYLNPISKSFSSHRYDTGDHKLPDPMLGTIKDFSNLCDAAHKLGMRVILDGVYSHTGDNSLYFDKYRTFGGNGAHCGPDSPYFSWYTFRQFPNNYESWWGFDTLPTVNKMDPNFLEYVITGEDSVVAHWLKLGADGFRLDVADELPSEFLALLKRRIRQIKPDALLIGEVWEDASNKIAYNTRRRYFVDGVLDSVMNYPFRTAILNYVKGWDDGQQLKDSVMTIVENYPPQVLACNMNLLGTHDTPRILTALVDDFDGNREELANRRLVDGQYALAQERLLMATCLQYTLPGSVSVYYGDEAGMEGHKDPFNRRTYPWGRENPTLIAHHRRLGQLRNQYPCLRTGNIEFSQAGDGKLRYSRTLDGHRVTIWFNRSEEPWDVPSTKLLYGHNLRTAAPSWITLLPLGFCITEE